MLQKTVMALMLTGAGAIPVASMANEAASFPQIQDEDLIYETGSDLDGSLIYATGSDLDGSLILVQSTGDGNGGFGGTGGYGGYGGSADSGSDKGSLRGGATATETVPPDAVGITHDSTAKIVALVQAGATYCQKVSDPALKTDCLADRFYTIAMSLPTTGGYADMRAELLDTANKLHALAVKNADPTKAPRRPHIGSAISSRPLIAVKNPDAVNAQAALIVNGAALVLLRSGSGSDQRRLAYQQVAAVVGSTKVLLRSA